MQILLRNIDDTQIVLHGASIDSNKPNGRLARSMLEWVGMTTRRILVVANMLDARALAELLSVEGYLTEVASFQSAKRRALQFRPDVVIADVAYPTIDGLSLLRDVQATDPLPHTIMVSSRPTHTLEALGVTCLSKPLDLSLLSRRLLELTAPEVPAASHVPARASA